MVKTATGINCRSCKRQRLLAGTASAVTSLALTACTPGTGSSDSTLKIESTGEAIDTITAQCADTEHGARGDLATAIPGERDRLTIGDYGARYSELAQESGAVFDPNLLEMGTDGPIVIVQRGGIAVSAYQFEHLPLEVKGTASVVSVDRPGEYTGRHGFCQFAAN